jgi:hypothetical protein
LLAAQVTSQRTWSGREVVDPEPAGPVGIDCGDAVLMADHHAGLPVGDELANHVSASAQSGDLNLDGQTVGLEGEQPVGARKSAVGSELRVR